MFDFSKMSGPDTSQVSSTAIIPLQGWHVELRCYGHPKHKRQNVRLAHTLEDTISLASAESALVRVGKGDADVLPGTRTILKFTDCGTLRRQATSGVFCVVLALWLGDVPEAMGRRLIMMKVPF